MEDEQANNCERDHPKKGDKKKEKGKGQQQNKADKIDSIFVARQLIMGDSANISKRLLEFKNFKNPNYEKFAQKICDNLYKSNFSFGGSVDKFIQINSSAAQDNTTGHQMGTILKGFYKYWSEFPGVKQQGGAEVQSIDRLFNLLPNIYSPMSKLFIGLCRKLIKKYLTDQVHQFQEKSLQMANKFIKSNSRADQTKALPLIYEYNLYGDIPLGKIVDLVLRQPNIVEYIYLFRSQEGKVRQNLVKIYIDRTVNSSPKDITKCEKLIRDLDLDPFQFDNYITKLQEKYINYITRQYKLFYIELLIHLNHKLIFLLIEELFRRGRKREANYFISKYHFQDDFNCHFTNKQKDQFAKIRNVLLDCDAFGPTEVVVLEEEDNEENFLYLGHFGIKQKDVIFIDGKNIDQFNFKEQFNSKVVSIDSERAGGVHVFDPSQTQIFQLFTGRRIFIFDYRDLRQHNIFKQTIMFMLTNCKIYGQDHIKELTGLQRELNLKIDEKVMQELMRSRAVDSAKYFKQVFPKQNKSSLLHMCETVFNKKLSKYEQCSGWRNRPLRKAQLHYAALDALLPREICRQLEKLQKSKKQKQ